MTTMMTGAGFPRESGPTLAPRRRREFAGPLLVAVGNSDSAGGALRLAELLARRDRLNAHVLSAVPPLPFTAALITGIDATAVEAARRQEHLARVRRRVHQTVGRSAHFSTGVEPGSLGPVISRVARDRSTELILVGIDARGATGRAASEDAALQVIRAARVPVLVVPPHYKVLPRRAVVAVDFAEASVRAARAALLTLAPGARLTLAHVEPELDFRELGKEGWGEVYMEGVAGLFRRLVMDLRAPGDVEIETVIIKDEPVSSLLELATRSGSDLIAAGSRSGQWPDEDLGSVSAALVRGAGCAVLTAPPSRRAHHLVGV